MPFGNIKREAGVTLFKFKSKGTKLKQTALKFGTAVALKRNCEEKVAEPPLLVKTAVSCQFFCLSGQIRQFKSSETSFIITWDLIFYETKYLPVWWFKIV